jgi:hypothetical protein
MSWMGEVLEKTRKINAQVQWPPDWEVTHVSQQDWMIRPLDESPESGEAASPELGEVDLDIALKGKPRWRKPPAS